MNSVLAEILAGLIMLTYVYCIKYTTQGYYFAYILVVSWSIVLFVLLWIMFYCNEEIANKMRSEA